MRKIGKITLACILSVLLSVGCFAGCRKKKKDNVTTVNMEDMYTYNGTHVFDAPETDTYFVQNGATEYRLVYSPDEIAQTRTARDEFAALYKHATGNGIATVPDTGLTQTATGKYISFGNTSLYRSSGLNENTAELTADGVRIVTKDDTVYLLGGGYDGLVNAVYDFMNIMFHYETYYIDCMEIDRNVRDRKMRAFDVTDIPDLQSRIAGVGTLTEQREDYDENMYGTRLRYNKSTSDFLLPIHRKFDDPSSARSTFHNCSYYMSREDEGVRSEWFSTGGNGQLCYTAHGDSESFKQMVDYCVRKVISSLKMYTPDRYPLWNTVTITMMDSFNECYCDACSAMAEKYGGTHAATAIPFVNAMATEIRAWMEKEENAAYAREDFKVVFFAYHAMKEAPVEYNEKTGEYKIMGDEMKFVEGAGVWQVSDYDFQSPIYSEANRNTYVVRANKWATLTDYLILWTYNHNYPNYMYFYDAFGFYTPETYAYFANSNVKVFFDQSQFDQKGTLPIWRNLFTYLESKLAWNSSLDYQTLVKNYCNAVFKEAAPVMRAMFDGMRARTARNNAKYDRYGRSTISFNTENRDEWPYQTLKQWMDMCDDSIALIEDLYGATDPQKRKAIVGSIEAEWIAPAYATIKLYGGTGSQYLSAEQIARLKLRFNDVATRSGISHVGEGSRLKLF